MSEEPKRLLEDPELAVDLRAGLEAFGVDAVDYDVAAGAARFDASLTPSAGTGTVAATAAGSKTALVVVAVVAAAAAVAAWVLAGGDSKPVADREPAAYAEAEPQARVHAIAPPVAVAPTTPEAAQPAADVEVDRPRPVPSPDEVRPGADDHQRATPEPAANRGHTHRPSKPRPKVEPSRSPEPTPPVESSEEGPDSLEAEMRATKAARDALSVNPRNALRLARQADAAFPDGVFGPEREGIIVLALLRMEAGADARRRAKAYLDAHPKGAYAQRVRAALEK